MFENIISLFFPKVCAGCQSLLLSHEKIVCTDCRHHIPLTCHHLNPENEAFKKFYGKIPIVFACCFVYFHKKGIVQNMIHNLKYRGHEDVGSFFGDWFSEDLKTIPGIETVDVIIPVPLHPKKMKQRGYNQVTAFGLSLSQSLNFSYDDSILIRKIYSKTQTKKDLLTRTEVNKQNIFDVNLTTAHHNKHYLLIDDVLTTGSTLEACCHALMKIPGARISIACMAMSH
ncbi:phosphoribosyltransferase family protein [Flavobacterium sp.]|uniref:ComF family protein n=1 Tax=Flavobacterium sp. TaxID=239 RepID=UPI00260705AE|nr:phosphoribosyltransferase family protein [Flavobacterium sp.]